MTTTINREERDAALFHGAYALLCLMVLLAVPAETGIKMLILVAFYVIALPVAATARGHRGWRDLWFFSLALSVFQVFPDWFLSRQLGILVFPEDGLFKIGTVSGYMAGLWTIPIFIITFVSSRMEERFSPKAGYAAAAFLALVIFGISEETVWILPSWYARNVLMVGHTAVYIILPEMLLGLASFYAFRHVRDRAWWTKIQAAFAVMIFYLGSAAFFYFIVERLLRND